MNRNGRLSACLHVLLHMAERSEPMTSEAIAECLGTNPVVVRRTMAGLRDAGLVASERGPGGGWRLAVDLASVSLRDVYEAIGEPSFFALSEGSEDSSCLVERAVFESLDDVFREASARILERMGKVKMSTLAAKFHRGSMQARRSLSSRHGKVGKS